MCHSPEELDGGQTSIAEIRILPFMEIQVFVYQAYSEGCACE